MKVLLLDPAFAAVPIHDFLTSEGCEVWTMGNRDYDPLAIAAPERWIKGDYGDAALVSATMQQHGFDALVPGCTDVSMHAFVRTGHDEFYRYSLEADQILNKKTLFRELCSELNLPAPRAVPIDSLPDEGLHICKPADSFSGRGVTVFDAADKSASRDAIENAIRHSATGQAVCETFVEGQLYSYSAFLEGGAVETAFIVREGARYDPFAVDTSHVVHDYNPDHQRQLRAAVEAVSARLQLCDGLLHVQFIDAGNRIAILEMTRRCPGDLYSMLIEYSTGQPYAARYASYFVGKTVPAPTSSRRHVLRHTLKQTGPDSFRGFDLDLGPSIFRLVPVVRLGQPLDAAKPVRVGLAFLGLSSADALEECFKQLVGCA